MPAISLEQATRRGRLSRMAVTAEIKFGRWAGDGGRYSVRPAQLRERFEVGKVNSRSQGFACGFVDFLLGRVARHSR